MNPAACIDGAAVLRQLAEERERTYRCKICGGIVDLTDAEYPSVNIGAGKHE